MKVRISRIENWDFDINTAMKEMGYKSFREVGEKVGLNWTYINKIANGMVCDEKTAGLIIRKMSEPKLLSTKTHPCQSNEE